MSGDHHAFKYSGYYTCLASLVTLLLSFSPLASLQVQAFAYSEIWVWGGQLPEHSEGIETLYLLQGNFWIERDFRYEFQGPRPQRTTTRGASLVLTYRLDELVPTKMIASRYYDSPTSKLQNYAHWLKRMRGVLHEDIEISITGLGDWLVSARVGDLRDLSQQADYIAFMMYHGHRPLKPLQPFTSALVRYRQPFKVGLLRGQGAHEEIGRLRRASSYRGKIIFLLPGERP